MIRLNILFLTDELLSKEEILTTAKFYDLADENINLSVLSLDKQSIIRKQFSEADIIVTNTTRLTEAMLDQAPNLLLICSLNAADELIAMSAAEKKGILVLDASNNQLKAIMRSKLQNLQIIFSELEALIKGKPLNHLVKPIHSS